MPDVEEAAKQESPESAADGDNITSEQDDQFDQDADQFLKETEGDYNDYDPEDYERARRKQVTLMDIMLISCIVVLILVFAIALPFVLTLNKNDSKEASAVAPNATTMAPTPMVDMTMPTLVPVASPSAAIADDIPTIAPSLAPDDLLSYSVVGGPFVGASGTMFGASASLDGNLAVVSAPLANGVGAITTYTVNGRRSNWLEQAQTVLTGSPSSMELFGSSLQLRNNRLIVGAPGMTEEDAAANATTSGIMGAAIVYDYNRNTTSNTTTSNPWTQLGSTLRGATDSAAAKERFGAAVAMGSDDDNLVAVVGAPMRNQASGGVYTFRYTALTNWFSMTAVPLSEDTMFGGGMLGAAVAITGDGMRMMAGAPEWGGGFGKALVYDWNATASAWIKVWDMPGANSGGKFGSSVIFLDSQTIAIGEPGAFSWMGRVTVFRQQSSNGASFEQLGPSIDGAEEQSIGRAGAIAGISSEDGTASLLVAAADGMISRYDYNGSEWIMPSASIDVDGVVTALGAGAAGNAFIIGNSDANTAAIYDA